MKKGKIKGITLERNKTSEKKLRHVKKKKKQRTKEKKIKRKKERTQ